MKDNDFCYALTNEWEKFSTSTAQTLTKKNVAQFFLRDYENLETFLAIFNVGCPLFLKVRATSEACNQCCKPYHKILCLKNFEIKACKKGIQPHYFSIFASLKSIIIREAIFMGWNFFVTEENKALLYDIVENALKIKSLLYESSGQNFFKSEKNPGKGKVSPEVNQGHPAQGVMRMKANAKLGELLDEAKDIITKDRQTSYGDPVYSFGKIAKLWSAYLGFDISPWDVTQLMILLKISRAKTGRHERDNMRDVLGYATIAEDIFGEDK